MARPIQKIAEKLIPYEILIVGIAVAAGFISTRALPSAPIAAIIFFLLRAFAHQRLSVRTPVDWPVVGLVLMILVTLWVTAFPELTRPQVYRLLSGIALYYALVNWVITPARLRWVARGAAAGGFLLAAFATISVEWATNKVTFVPDVFYRSFRVLVGDPVHPNVIAGSLVILLPVALAVLLFAGKQLHWLERVLTGLAIVGMAAILVLTLSRGAWLTTGVALAILVTLRWRYGWLGSILVAAAGGGLIYLVGAQQVLMFLLSTSTLPDGGSRLEFWARALHMIQDFPFTGIGMGSFTPVADLLYPFYNAAAHSLSHAHNLFLQIAVDLGLPGLIAWLAIFITMVALSWRLVRLGKTSGDGWLAGLGAGLLCSQVALAVHGMFDAVTWGMVRPAPIVWALWGMIAASWGIYSRLYAAPANQLDQ